MVAEDRTVDDLATTPTGGTDLADLRRAGAASSTLLVATLRLVAAAPPWMVLGAVSGLVGCGGAREAVVDAALGDDDASPVDARVADARVADARAVDARPPNGDGGPGPSLPTAVTRAYVESGGTWTEVGDADWSCLGLPSTDPPPGAAIAVTGIVRDWRRGDGVGGLSVSAWAMPDPVGPSLGGATTSTEVATRGRFAATLEVLPPTARRYGFTVAGPGVLTTHALARLVVDGATALDLPALSESIANALPALVGVNRDVGAALGLGALRDCQGRTVANTVVIASATAGAFAPPPGPRTYYFAPGSGLPVRPSEAPVTAADGRFLAIDLSPERPTFVQAWGFRDAGELAAGSLTLLAEVPAPTIANQAFIVDLTARRAP